jgi:hypothetical protein
LIFSKENNLQGGTLTYVENLERILSKNLKNKHKSLEFPLEKIGLSDVSHARTIKNEIMQSRITKISKNEQLHLNYTGGTKSMSVHIYWILKELFREKITGNISFSYLDARNFRLVDDDKEQIIDGDLRKKVSLSFADLIELHGYQIDVI